MPTTQELATIAAARAAGHTLQEIGAQIGLDKSNICRSLQRPDVRAQVDAIRDRIMREAADTAAGNLIHAISSYREAPREDRQLREHGYRASAELMRGIGILPSHAPSIAIQQIVDARSVQISPDLARAVVSSWSDAAGFEPPDLEICEQD